MIFQWVKDYCEREGISIAAFEKKCGIGNGTVDDWGKEVKPSIPSMASLIKISEATGVSLSDLVCMVKK